MTILKRRNQELSFGVLFYTFALLYFLLFYIVPLALVLIEGGSFFYAREFFNFSIHDLMSASLMGILFWTFFSVAAYFLFRTRVSAKNKISYLNKKKLRIFAVLYILSYFAYFYAFNDINQNYAIRQGEIKGSHLLFFISIFVNVLGMYLAIRLDDSGLEKYAILVLLSIFLATLFSGGGRYGLILALGMTAILIFKIKLTLNRIFLGSIVLLLLIPTIINMKSIIYTIATGGSFSDIDFSTNYSADVVGWGYLQNFGHPIVSLLLADSTIEQIGYRLFYDYIQGFLFFFRIIGFDFGDSLTYFNTYTVLGSRESVIPPGYIAFGFIQMHFLGVMVSGVFFAIVGLICDRVRVVVAPRSELAKYYFSILAANSFYHGEVRLIIMTVFLSLALMLTFNKVEKLKFGF